MRTYKLDFEVGHGCNFRCKYCFEQYGQPNYADVAMPYEIADRGVQYARHVLGKLPDDSRLVVCFFGGEPLLYIDTVVRVVEALQSEVSFTIVTNGSLIETNADMLLHLKSLVGNSLRVCVSYDYSMQDSNRQSGTYDSVRDGIRWLCHNGFKTSTITVFTEDGLTQADTIFSDYLVLRRECSDLEMIINTVHGNGLKSIDERKVRETLGKVKLQIKRSNSLEKVRYNAGCGYRGERYPGCVFGRVYAGINTNGDLYPGYSVIHNDEITRKTMYLGNINEDFAVLDKKRDDLISSLNYNIGEECRNCGTPCQLLPWNTIQTGAEEFNAMPEENHCRIHKLVKKYLPHE